MTEGSFHQLVALLHCRSLHKVRSCVLACLPSVFSSLLPLLSLPLCPSLSPSPSPLLLSLPSSRGFQLLLLPYFLKAIQPLKPWNESLRRLLIPWVEC